MPVIQSFRCDGGRSAPASLSLQISGNQRFLVDQNGKPFFVMLDAGWEAPAQLTSAQIDQYLDDRKARGFTASILQMTNMLYSSQQPTYQNAYGNNPFSTINNTGSPYYLATTCDFSTTVDSYWQIVDYMCAALLKRNMVGVFFPAYVGFPTSPAQGWYTPMMADTTGHLQTFGAFIANRYGNYKNIIWGMSGDNTLSQADLTQNWNIVTGMRSVRTDMLIYAKAQRNVSGWTLLTNDGGLSLYPGFNVNNAYIKCESGNYTQITDSAAEYGRSPILPFFVDETDYEGDGTATAQDLRIGMYGPMCSGACGVTFGNEQLWGFGCANNLIANGPAATLASSLNTTGSQQTTILMQLVNAFAWQLLVPQTGTALVTTALGSGSSAIAPALASDGTFAFIHTAAGTGFTVQMSAVTHSSVVARWFDPGNGTYTTDSASPLSNTGTHAFTTPGTNSGGGTDWVLVLN
jgi:Protein of unknown function (DUF4038)/Putative collagen-binding domain of a collagenase